MHLALEVLYFCILLPEWEQVNEAVWFRSSMDHVCLGLMFPCLSGCCETYIYTCTYMYTKLEIVFLLNSVCGEFLVQVYTCMCGFFPSQLSCLSSSVGRASV